MLGSIYGTKVIYGQRVIYLNLPYAERAYGAGVASIAGDDLTLSCAIKALSVDEATVKSLTQAFIGHLEPNGIANTIGHVAVTSDTTSLARAVAADSSYYSVHPSGNIVETTAALANVISISGDEARHTFNQIARVMLIPSKILKTFYALLPEQITEATVQPEYLTQHDPYIHYTTESEVY